MAQTSKNQPEPPVQTPETKSDSPAQPVVQSAVTGDSKQETPKAAEPPAATPKESSSDKPVTPLAEAPPAPTTAPSPAPTSVPAAPTAPAADTPKIKVPSFLYVEDDPFSREVITRLITQNMGFPNLTVFNDSSDFMARVKKLPAVPDVIMLDIQISPLNGHQMLKLLREDETFKKSRIIALTASVMASEVKQLQDAGFDGLIGKPVMKRVFPELLQRVLDGEPVWYVS